MDTGDKVCRVCEKSLPLSAYAKDKSMHDQCSTRCRGCDREARIRSGQQKPAGWIRKTADIVAYRVAYNVRNRKRLTRLKEAWTKANPIKAKARYAIKYAVKAGHLVRLPCFTCGATEHIHAHHASYDLPLCVIWLCKDHHRQVHAEAKAYQSAPPPDPFARYYAML